MKPARSALLALAVLVGLLAGAAGAEEWRPFTGTWTLAGKRFSLPTSGPRRAHVIHASGNLVITRGETLGRGFFGEVVGFDDGETLLVGRAVFTDSLGEKVFATLKAQPLGANRTATATITGGTGRWAGLEGEFTFSWRFVVETGEEDFDAFAVNLEGRARKAAQGSAPAAAPKETPK